MTRRVRGALEPGRDRLRFVAEEPARPGGVVVPFPKHNLGVDYDTSWARRYPVRLVRRWCSTTSPGRCCTSLSHPRS